MDGKGWERSGRGEGEEKEDVVYRGITKRRKRLSPPTYINLPSEIKTTASREGQAGREGGKRNVGEVRQRQGTEDRVEITGKVLVLALLLCCAVVLLSRQGRVEIQKENN